MKELKSRPEIIFFAGPNGSGKSTFTELLRPVDMNYINADEIKAVVKDNFDKTVEFIDIPSAEQYRISQKMRNI